jgi:hypothetical protein
MLKLLRLLACTVFFGAAVASAQVAHPAPTSPEAVLAAKCKRCIKNGFLD